MSDETPAERVSRFREHTNTNSSIRPPPDELWKDLDIGIEKLIDGFNDENDTPAVRKQSHPRQILSPTSRRGMSASTTSTTSASTAAARKGSDAAATVATAEGTFGRFSRLFGSVFSGVLGKRKAGHMDAESAATISAEQQKLDERKRAAEEAYHLAKEQGLLPAPKVFVRPGMTPRAWSADTPSRPRPPLTPRTPGSVVRSPSKKDLNKQKKLSKRVSSLEVKLASAKKELREVLGNECFPPVPAFPQHLEHTGVGGADQTTSPTPNHVFSDEGVPLSPTIGHGSGLFGEGASASLPGKITKKRKSVALIDHDNTNDLEYLPTATATAIASDVEMSEAEPDAVSPAPKGIKRVKSDASKRLKRTSSRLSRKVSRSSVREEREEKVVVVKPGGNVPPVPIVPQGLEGNKVKVVGDDGYGGLGHEIF